MIDDEISIRRVLHTDVPVVRPEQSLVDVARALVAAGASSLPVLDDEGTLVGIVSEYDVLAKPGAAVGDVMSRGVISIGPDATAADAAHLMGSHGVRVLPVVAGERLLGVVTRADLVRLYTETRWICATCGEAAYGLSRPSACVRCGGADVTLERPG